ncbi:hypothetical protein EI555_014493, partial [Monodon monoceros]
QTSGGGTHSGPTKSSYRPLPLPRLWKVADALTVGPKTLHPRQPLEFPTPKGDKGAKEKLPGAGARSARPPQLRTWESRGAVARRGANPPPPNSGTGSTLTGVEPPERRGAGGRFLWGPARVQSNPNFSRPLSPAAAGARAQTKSAAWPPRRNCPFGPLGGRELRPCAGSGRTPFSSRDDARRRPWRALLCLAGDNWAGATVNTWFRQSLNAAEPPLHPLGRSREANLPPPAPRLLRRGLRDRSCRALPHLRRLHRRAP